MSGSATAFSQFSPGELSKAHQQLEGMTNCLQCHESGNEISGNKCLTCHQEVKALRDGRHGFHFSVASKQCIACHKEHLGRTAQTVVFDKNTFDHIQTGFSRTGKHASADCASCHTKKFVKEPKVLSIIAKTGRDTYLGLSRACVACHEDRHDGKMGKECQSCHDAKAWSPAINFDHAKTTFVLVGRHARVECSKCHDDLARKNTSLPVSFGAKSFEDCAPCHASPHTGNFARQACRSCHSPEDWKSSNARGKFNHDQTQFKLVGRHEIVACEKCHKTGVKSSFRSSLRMAHNACTDCHSDYHVGEFTAKFKNQCESCHTPFGFLPARFSFIEHNAGRFALKGAHAAIPCERCHTQAGRDRKSFRFADMRCEACHKDKHGGQFAAEMRTESCGACHSVDDWFPKSFDHAKTRFALAGKHARISCGECHKQNQSDKAEAVRYKGLPLECTSCHKDVHEKQFAVRGGTQCESCHQPEGWKMLVFNHDKQSAFALTGAHARVACRQCHKEERKNQIRMIRFKPVSTSCESCHGQSKVGNG